MVIIIRSLKSAKGEFFFILNKSLLTNKIESTEIRTGLATKNTTVLYLYNQRISKNTNQVGSKLINKSTEQFKVRF